MNVTIELELDEEVLEDIFDALQHHIFSLITLSTALDEWDGDSKSPDIDRQHAIIDKTKKELIMLLNDLVSGKGS